MMHPIYHSKLIFILLSLAVVNPTFPAKSAEVKESSKNEAPEASEDSDKSAVGNQPPAPPELNCFARCLAICMSGNGEGGGKNPKSNPLKAELKGTELSGCREKCKPYSEKDLCGPLLRDTRCWRTCKDLGDNGQPLGRPHPKSAPPSVEGLNASYGVDGRLRIAWAPSTELGSTAPTFYLIQYRPVNQLKWVEAYSTEEYIDDLELADAKYMCSDLQIRVSAISPSRGVEGFSPPVLLEELQPPVLPKMKLKSIVYERRPLEVDGYRANGTLVVTLEYEMSASWVLGEKDLEVEPLFHMLGCAEPDLSQAVPVPTFQQASNSPHAVEAKLGADMMLRRCRFVYVAQRVKSKKCGVSYPLTALDDDYSTVEITCDSVQNSDCHQIGSFPPPLCGHIDEFHYSVVNDSEVDWYEREVSLVVNVSFTPRERRSAANAVNNANSSITTARPLYYIALWGDAVPYEGLGSLDDGASSILNSTTFGVNMTNVEGTTTNCKEFEADGRCKLLFPSAHSILLSNLSMDHLYGVMLCGVRDPRNLSLPSVSGSNERFARIKSHPVRISSAEYKQHSILFAVPRRLRPAAISAITLVATLSLIGLSVTAWLLWRKHVQESTATKKKSASGGANSQRSGRNATATGTGRYVDFPRPSDQWELERRQLVIYDEKRLGSGAFGAVYLGRLLGAAKGLRELLGSSTLGMNLMRAENCDVAVKMLPEYADELSKSEFLREIALMKTLGYHERLVNMLACITTSEPLCLVVEYCSDGDLLHFLRARCDYMLGLTERQIDYTDAEVNNDGRENGEGEQLVDFSMIMTLRQLLQFAVQISYGLEYLAQRGFVHRDIAARNILVNEKCYAKIGDFGLCRYIYAQSGNYRSNGGRLPIKWMAPESIRHYEFTTRSDVWSFGVLLFEIITLGGTPYPGVQPDDMLPLLEAGRRLPQPDNCPDAFYEVMKSCWTEDPVKRADCSAIRQRLALQLEEIGDGQYSYLRLDSQKDYYRASRDKSVNTLDTCISPT